MTGASGGLVVVRTPAPRPSVAEVEGPVVLDVKGDELAAGYVVTFPLPSGDWARGFVVAIEDHAGIVEIRMTIGWTHRVLGANCELQLGPSGKPLVCIERAGNLTGFAEVEAA